jgi:hypothetical protein
MTSLELCSQLKDFAQKWYTLGLSLNYEYFKKIPLTFLDNYSIH